MTNSSTAPAWQTAWNFLGNLPDHRARQFGQFIWALIAVIVFTIVAIDPMGRSATAEYQKASTRWWGGEQSLYKGKNNYLYLPQAAMIYTPFNVLPRRVGEPLWRLVCLGSLAFAIWTAAKHLAPERPGSIFLIATVLTLPCMLSSARNGQVNMPLAAIYLLTALALSRDRWHLAAILLAISLALKPISIVPILLCGALYPRLILPLILWLGAMFAAAFLHPDPKYVAWQYEAFWTKLTGASKPSGHTWCDFAGMLKSFGLTLPDKVHLLIRAGMAAVTFAIGLLVVFRTKDPLRRALTVMLFAVMYLMLFNPRTETNSYIILGIFVGLLGAYEAIVTRNLRATAGWIIVAILLGTENYGWPIFPWTNLWLKALLTLTVAVWLTIRVIKMPSGGAVIFTGPR